RFLPCQTRKSDLQPPLYFVAHKDLMQSASRPVYLSCCLFLLLSKRPLQRLRQRPYHRQRRKYLLTGHFCSTGSEWVRSNHPPHKQRYPETACLLSIPFLSIANLSPYDSRGSPLLLPLAVLQKQLFG